MKKVKISELPLYNSLKGLFTIGTDKDNRSVKVSLEFVEDAADRADTAAANADKATERADNATALARQATTNALEATATANASARRADTSAEGATLAKNNAVTATANANNAATEAVRIATQAGEDSKAKVTQAVKDAERDVSTAVANATAATNDAIAAHKRAIQSADMAEDMAGLARDMGEQARLATQEMREQADEAMDAMARAFARLVPTVMEVESIERITLGNLTQNRIRAILKPYDAPANIVFISDNKAVETAPDGTITAIAEGASLVQVIPTLNTALAKVIRIEVTAPTARLVNTRSRMRLTASGAIRLN